MNQLLDALTFDPEGYPNVVLDLSRVPSLGELREVTELAIATLALPAPFTWDEINLTVRNVSWWTKNVLKDASGKPTVARETIETVAEDTARVFSRINSTKTPKINFRYWS